MRCYHLVSIHLWRTEHKKFTLLITAADLYNDHSDLPYWTHEETNFQFTTLIYRSEHMRKLKEKNSQFTISKHVEKLKTTTKSTEAPPILTVSFDF